MRFFTLNNQPFAEVTTRAPAKMHIYSKSLAIASKTTLRKLYCTMAQQFLAERPWERGLKWRPTQSLTQTLEGSIGKKSVTGWMQVNMRLPQKIAQDLERLSHEQDTNLSVVLYTMLYWYTWFIYPPASEQARRAEHRKMQMERSVSPSVANPAEQQVTL